MSFKALRITLLLIVLALVIHNVFNDRARIASWDVPLFITVYPINADGSEVVDRYLSRLTSAQFQAISEKMKIEAQRWGLTLDTPMYIELAEQTDNPPPPTPIGGNVLERAWWVLKLRWWRWQFDDQGRDPDILVIANYYAPTAGRVLPHSTGLERVRIAVANLFASRGQEGENRVVLLHEVLHTVGATDKYDLSNNRPIYPQGYAEPDRRPRYPQRTAEIMAGRIPISQTRAEQAPSLNRTIIGPVTAAELGWTSPEAR